MILPYVFMVKAYYSESFLKNNGTLKFKIQKLKFKR